MLGLGVEVLGIEVLGVEALEVEVPGVGVPEQVCGAAGGAAGAAGPLAGTQTTAPCGGVVWRGAAAGAHCAGAAVSRAVAFVPCADEPAEVTDTVTVTVDRDATDGAPGGTPQLPVGLAAGEFGTAVDGVPGAVGGGGAVAGVVCGAVTVEEP
ncbi:hypothetical protein [Blastococcus mobilis]|uniref:hypothetical protein n=1 Tax=Blastococcus mobilis TaxID=1938746 RepID=UPI0011316593|nr:hypothetical protein [Blastococcus mobilis]